MTPVFGSILIPEMSGAYVKVLLPVPPEAEMLDEEVAMPKLVEMFDPPESVIAEFTLSSAELDVAESD